MAADRISELPDPILHHILSYLPTKLVVKTSILSKRWRYLWASCSHVHIGIDDFPSITSFERFTEAVLLCRDASSAIQTFHLCWDRDYDQFHADIWIYHAVQRSVRELDLALALNGKLPRCIFTCKTLSILKLTLNNHLRDMEFPINLSRLETLHLSATTFEGDTLVKLISGCPVLECLKMMFCKFYVLEINSRKLKHLDLLETGSRRARVRVVAPGLKSLDIRSLKAQEISLEHLTSLERADLRNLTFHGETRVFRSLYAVSSLQLNDSALEYIFKEMLFSQSAPTRLQRLKNLKLMTCMSDAPLEAITCLLHQSPNLENLVIEFYKEARFERTFWEEKRPVPDSFFGKLELLGNLKSVEIRHFKSRTSTHELVKFFLSNGKRLEKMLIIPKQG
ncbi:F-box/LRR-repeat protein 25-like isoform X1 [Phoenix dactylifera]|uniref:F-box/LRR-repeat protein 25-like isoform X1 n=1 Tax=Phoenix dactylifera TaxID=42345 RepID=A0A8B8J0L3_PHODC|nr:F-box/LRR-repeat protein 25-like isoform X1 [Phoenix dactylifera]